MANSMKNRYRRTAARTLSWRQLVVQRLEHRWMLAADCSAESMPAEGEIEQASVVRASDAGSTLGTAFDLGTLSDRRLQGTLGLQDTVDVIGFDVANRSEFSASLSGFGGDVDLALIDRSGQLLGHSHNPLTSREQILATLEPGEYFVVAYTPRFTFGAFYTLNLEVDDAPSPAPGHVPTAPGPNEPDSSAPSPGNTTPPDANVEPFPEVPYLGSQIDVHLNAVNAPEAFAQGYTGEGVTVAIVDSGVDLDHPDLVSNLFVNPGEIPGNGIDDDANGFVDDVNGYDFVDRDARPDDTNGHGTHVAGTVAAARNDFGTTGVAPNASILPVRVLGTDGSGSSFDVAAGIRYAADLGAQIINLSLGGGYSRSIEQAIQYAGRLGSIVIAAAGNESSSVPGFPARFSATQTHVLSVGAVNSSDTRAGFSNRVGSSGAVQIDAPGVGVYSTYPGGRYASLSGTSMAAPHVAGVAALALQANPNLTASQLRGLLVDGADAQARGSDAIGLVNAATTVAYAAAGLTSSGSTTPTGPSSASGHSSTQSGRSEPSGGYAPGTSPTRALTARDVSVTADEPQRLAAGIVEEPTVSLLAQEVATRRSAQGWRQTEGDRSFTESTTPQPLDLEAALELLAATRTSLLRRA